MQIKIIMKRWQTWWAQCVAFGGSGWGEMIGWFVLFMALYICWPARPYASYDNHATALLPFAIIRGDGFSLYNFVEGQQAIKIWNDNILNKRESYEYIMVGPTGEVISDYPIFSALLLFPWYGLYGLWEPALWQAISFSTIVQQADYLAAVGMTVITAYFWFRTACTLGYSRKLATIIILIGIFATPVISVSSRFVWQHTTALLLISAALYFFYRQKWLLVSSLVVMSILARPATTVLGLPVLIFAFTQIMRSISFKASTVSRLSRVKICCWKPIKLKGIISIGMVLAACVAVVLQIWYAQRYLGTWFGFAPQYHVARFELRHFWQGLAGQFLSPGRGMLFYSPFLVFAAWGLWIDRKKNGIWLLGLIFYYVMNAAWDMWHGGWSLSYRLIMDGIPVLLIGLLVFFHRYHRNWLVFLVLMIAVTWSVLNHAVVGGLVGDCDYNLFPYNIDWISYKERQKRLWTEMPLQRCYKKYILRQVQYY